MIGASAIPVLVLVAIAALATAFLIPKPATRSASGLSLRGPLKAMHSDWSLTFLVFVVVLTMAAIALPVGLAAESVLLGVIVGVAAAPVVVWQVLRLGQQRYRDRFRRQFLPALEIIVRGLRSGMPLLSALQVVQKEIDGPMRAEFRRLLDDLALGLSLAQAVERMADRVPTTEVRFFAAAIAFQARTGGRLSEALENLAGTLRARDLLDQRIRTVSHEARTSAIIIAVLPVLVTLGLFLFSPDYIALLFSNSLGRTVLVAAALWMLCGAWIMKRMTVIDV